MIEVLTIRDSIPGCVPGDDARTLELPCTKHPGKGLCVQLRVDDDKLHAASLCGCKEAELLAMLAEQSPLVREILGHADVAQLEEQHTRNVQAGGSTPPIGSNLHQGEETRQEQPQIKDGTTIDDLGHATAWQANGSPKQKGKQPRWKQANAIAYARHGIRVFPCHEIEADGFCSCGATACKSAGKHPRIKDWQILATCNEDEIRKWWAQWPGANVGVACGQSSNLTVLDVDGDVGREALRTLEMEHGELPETPIAITGSGGAHYYFAFERGPNNAVRFAPGLDIRTEGGLVVGVGSRNGKGSYEWEAAFTLGADGLLPSAMPRWLVEAIAAGQKAQAPANGKVMLPAKPMAEGEGRNNTLYRLGRSLKAQGLPQSAIEYSLSASNATFAQPLDNQELTQIISQVLHQPDQAGFGNVQQSPAQEPESALPTIFIRKKIEILTLDKLRERRQSHVQKWVVDPWLARGELSIWSGKVEHGKTSLLRELVMCALRGEKFLDRPTTPCRVFYAMLDADGEDLTYDEFEQMGINEHDTPNIMFMFEPMLAAMENGPEQFFKALWEWRPDLVIIDPVARLKTVADFLDYNNTYMMAMLSQYAKTLDAHFCLPMHIPRGRPAGSSAATAAFGSVAWGASANARFVVERKEPSDVHVIRTSKGKSAGFQGLEGEHVLEMNQYTHRITLGKPLSFGDRARGYKSAVLDFLRGAPCEEFTADALSHQMGEMRAVIQAAANMLCEDQENYRKQREHGNPTGVVRTGKGKRGSPFIYRYDPPRDESIQASDSISNANEKLF